MTNVVVYGGHFNPIHSAHEMIMSEVNAQIKPDHFLIMPSYISPLKDIKDPIDIKHRIHMVELVIQNLGFGTLRMDEIDRKGQSYTYDTMCALSKEFPDAQFYFVIGTDQYQQLHRWYKIEALKSFVTFIVVNRGEEAIHESDAVKPLSIPNMEISSTEIRQRCKSNQPIHMWVPLNVEKYIIEENLYG
ncbi:nicotinate (nicotinamide) nucleotide adenylyltransferase [Staphylococcus sp. 11261D007BR]